MVFSWLHIGIWLFLVAGVAFAAGPLAGSVLLAPRAKGGDLGMAYECGMRPHGPAKVRFGVNYYLYALLFLAFDVDVLYLFPVAVHYPESEGFVPFIKVFIFVFILALGVVYFWRKGVFEWPKRIQSGSN
jgi:NADH-quinone oxidoreductase subunit A